MTEPKPDAAELRDKIADGIPPSLIDSPAVGVGAARRLKLADAMLAAVEYAGYVITTPDRLLPADADVEWAWDCGERPHPHPHVGPESWVREIAPKYWPNGRAVCRRPASPWLPAPTEES